MTDEPQGVVGQSRGDRLASAITRVPVRIAGDLFRGDAFGDCRYDADSLNPGSCENAMEENCSSGFERGDERG